MPRRSRTKKSNQYFRKEHEQAIIEYCATKCNRRKTELYVTLLRPAFSEMVDKIVFTYKFTTLPNIDSLREECKVWLITVLDKFQPDKGHKAFSYFSVITKNWFIHKVKKQKRKNQREVEYDAAPKKYEQKYLSTDESWVTEQLEKEFWKSFYEDLKNWESNDMRENDERVYRAIIVLFESKDDIEIFNKKAIYLYLREITGLNTKQVVNSLNKFREQYRDFKSDWEDGKI
mgnify:FL=1|jgi:hypothetical protein